MGGGKVGNITARAQGRASIAAGIHLAEDLCS